MSDGFVGPRARVARELQCAGMLVLMPLLLVALAGCGTAARSVRLDTGQGEPLRHVPRGGQKPVELKRDEVTRALAELALDVRPFSRPMVQARRLMLGGPWQEEEVDLEWRDQHLVPASRESEAFAATRAPDEMTHAYGRWCERKGRPGDCLRLLTEGPSLNADGRYTLAFAIALDSVWGETKLALGEMVNEQAVVATLYSAAAMYLMLWVLPEPVSKGLAATLTAALMAYLGVDTVWGLIGGWVRLVEEVDRAATFDELREAGERYGEVMGSNSARIFVMLTTAAIGNTAGLVVKGPGLPGSTQAAVLAEAQGGFRWAAVGEVRSVAVSAEGTFTLTLAPGAVAMSAQGEGGSGEGRTEHGRDRAAEARAGDTHRQVGDANRVIREGRKFIDNETGNTVHVSGDRIVITDPEGEIITQFRNPRANTQARIQKGRWIPVNE